MRIESTGPMPIDRLDAAALPRHVVGVPEIDHDNDDDRNFEPCDDADSEDDQDRDDKVRNPPPSVVRGGVVPKVEGISGEIMRAADQSRGSEGNYFGSVERGDEQQGKTSQGRQDEKGQVESRRHDP